MTTVATKRLKKLLKDNAVSQNKPTGLGAGYDVSITKSVVCISEPWSPKWICYRADSRRVFRSVKDEAMTFEDLCRFLEEGM
jgi:hypothetical protein